MAPLLGLVKLLSFADMLVNTAPQCTVLIVTIREAVKPKHPSYLPKDFGDIFSII